MKMSEIKELTDQELLERIDDTKNMLTRMKMNHAVSPLENPNQIKNVRKDVARLLTEQSQRELNKQND
ncbi:50S ribosomal protein L29 [Salinivirga cyanobacteriivorans]|uniref:Large ribosomal subunit protein uL29 n=1 Tax=Salinivirga cyanobacteriivorans TaxID=1307839 RepID=A0A0S2I2X5_9BACT|nr:50S ribosomal protein L29 [Salinivirga cyanobacteriivorans]ALO16670.1 50S ribosomal protein L29 [Salinivirga cyanobacteriivorans]